MKITSLLSIFLAISGSAAFAQQAKLDTTTFVTVGEGLAAGMADFALRDIYQNASFPTVVAQQMKTAVVIPLIQPPGLGNVPGFPAMPVRVPATQETTLRTPFPPPIFVLNLAIPGYKASDSVGRRPSAPLVRQDDVVQTSANFILGFPAMALGKSKPLWTQLEYAQQMAPTLVVVELGYSDVLEGAVTNNPSLMTDPATFQSNYTTILSGLKGTATVIAMTVPNPLDTAYFTSLTTAGNLLGASPSTLQGLYGLKSDDLLTPNGLMTIATQLESGAAGTLPAGSVVSGVNAAAVTARVQALNTAINSVAQSSGAKVFDLGAVFSSMRQNGVNIGTRVITANYMGGLYSLDGFYPGIAGHAVIANALISFINTNYSTNFAQVSVSAAATGDPAGRFFPLVKKNPGRNSTR
jgi:hypothetical protein